jgi:transposase
MTNEEKLIVINSYAAGVSPSVISKQIKKSANAISTFYSRWQLNKDLPPREKKSRSKISGSLGLAIKNLTNSDSRISTRKIASTLRNNAGEDEWTPSHNTVHKFLKKMRINLNFRL